MANQNTTKQEAGKKGFLFNVDILIEETSNGAALQSLLGLLNSSNCKDYKVNNGIELGKIIDLMLEEHKKSPTPAVAAIIANSKQAANKQLLPKAKEAAGAASAKGNNPDIYNVINYFKNNNTLIRLAVLKAKGVRLSIPCRILNFDENTLNLTIYHVDEKKVYMFNLTEIEDYAVT